MRSAAEMIEVSCPKCGEDYIDWDRPFETSPMQSPCPHCGYDMATDPVALEDGAWLPAVVDDEAI